MSINHMMIPVLLTVTATVIVFVGGLRRTYDTDIRLAIGMMLIVFNLVTFVLFAFDKFSAITKHSRVAEVVLFYMTFYGSPVGALLGMFCFNHKTSKGRFKVYVFPLMIFNMLWVFVYFMATARTSLSAAFSE